MTKEKIETTSIKKTKYIAIKTIKVLCNKEFQLIKDQEISKDIDKSFIKSLINSNLIKIG